MHKTFRETINGVLTIQGLHRCSGSKECGEDCFNINDCSVVNEIASKEIEKQEENIQQKKEKAEEWNF